MTMERHLKAKLRADAEHERLAGPHQPCSTEAQTGGGAARSVSEDGAAVSSDSGGAGAGTRPSNTYLQSSQGVLGDQQFNAYLSQSLEQILLTENDYSGPLTEQTPIPGAKLSIDWLEVSCLVTWDPFESDRQFRTLADIRATAREQKAPQQFTLADQVVAVHGLGVGSGRQKRLGFKLEFPGVVLALDDSDSQNRQQANGYVRITGEACLLEGALPTLRKVLRMISELGGIVTDSWVRRIDLCGDFPNVSLMEWFIPAFKNEQFLSRATCWNSYESKSGCTGATIGSHKEVRLNVYDKLKDTLRKNDEVVLKAMVQNVWGGAQPASAIRVEYQIHKAWLDRVALTNTRLVLAAIPAIIQQLTEPQKRPFFALLSSAVDRKNKHQSRALLHPEWLNLVQSLRELAGTTDQELQPLQRGSLSSLRTIKTGVSYFINDAAKAGIELNSRMELMEHVWDRLELHGFSDEDIYDKWHQKALKLGTLTPCHQRKVNQNEVPF